MVRIQHFLWQLPITRLNATLLYFCMPYDIAVLYEHWENGYFLNEQNSRCIHARSLHYNVDWDGYIHMCYICMIISSIIHVGNVPVAWARSTYPWHFKRTIEPFLHCLVLHLWYRHAIFNQRTSSCQPKPSTREFKSEKRWFASCGLTGCVLIAGT